MIFDVAVIGGGPAGYHCAECAGNRGLSAVLFEKNRLGGVCMNSGCIPTKAFLHTARINELAVEGRKYGVLSKTEGIDHSFVVERKRALIDKIGSSIVAAEKRSGVKVVFAEAAILDYSDSAFSIQAEGEIYKAHNVVCAMGSIPVMPKLPGIDESIRAGFLVNSEEILELKEVPARLAIIGGGVIGIEIAEYFSAAGSEVTIIEALPHIGGRLIDPDAGNMIRKNLEKKHIRVLTNCRVYRINGCQVSAMLENGEALREEFSKILVSVGRRPWLAGAGLENLGLEIEKTEKMAWKSGIRGVYFIGDCNGNSMLASTAYREAEAVVDDLCGLDTEIRYDLVPGTIFTHPETAWVGFTDEQCREKGIDFASARMSMNVSGRYMAENNDCSSFIKVTADRVTGKILGVTVVGDYSTEYILAAELMIRENYTVYEAVRIAYPHPTDCESIRAACMELLTRLKDR